MSSEASNMLEMPQEKLNNDVVGVPQSTLQGAYMGSLVIKNR
jgi:hypothetical protein